MVTLAGTENLLQFELHARAILGLPIPSIELERAGASTVILADKTAKNFSFTGIEKALQIANTYVRIFGKSRTRPYRKMSAALVYDNVGADMNVLLEKAEGGVAGCVKNV